MYSCYHQGWTSSLLLSHFSGVLVWICSSCVLKAHSRVQGV
uniref:Uncharacterized protein n=1 Tax=Anguilla anguilla TaxID=7936 RepID=A0A0E9SHF0_ANGAN